MFPLLNIVLLYIAPNSKFNAVILWYFYCLLFFACCIYYSIYYNNYYFDSGDYYQPPEEDFEINYVKVNGVDMTDFYWDISDSNDFIYQNALEYARDNRHEK